MCPVDKVDYNSTTTRGISTAIPGYRQTDLSHRLNERLADCNSDEGLTMLDRDQPEGGEDRVPLSSNVPFVMFVDLGTRQVISHRQFGGRLFDYDGYRQALLATR